MRPQLVARLAAEVDNLPGGGSACHAQLSGLGLRSSACALSGRCRAAVGRFQTRRLSSESLSCLAPMPAVSGVPATWGLTLLRICFSLPKQVACCS